MENQDNQKNSFIQRKPSRFNSRQLNEGEDSVMNLGYYSRFNFHGNNQSEMNVAGISNSSNYQQQFDASGTPLTPSMSLNNGGIGGKFGSQNFIFGENDNFKCDYMDSVKPHDWKNIPIPVVECIDKVILEFESLNHKLNKQFDGIKRFTKRMQFDQSKVLEQVKQREDQIESKTTQQINKMQNSIKQENVKTEIKFSDLQDRISSTVNELLFSKIPEIEKKVTSVVNFIEKKEYIGELEAMVNDIKKISDSFITFQVDLNEVKTKTDKFQEKLKTNHKNNFNNEQKISGLKFEHEQLQKELRDYQSLNNESYEKFDKQFKYDRQRLDNSVDDIRKLAFKVEIDQQYLEDRFKEFVEKEFHNLNNLVKGGMLSSAAGALHQQMISKLVNDEVVKILKNQDQDRDQIKAEFEDRFNELILSLKNLASNDGGKNLAGMTALGSVLKNLKTVGSPTSNEKYDDKFSFYDESIARQEAAIARIWKVLQLKQSKNESTFLKSKNLKRESSKNMTQARNFLTKDFSQIDELNDLQPSQVQHSSSVVQGREMNFVSHQYSNYLYSGSQNSRVDDLLLQASYSQDKRDKFGRAQSKQQSNDDFNEFTQNTGDKRDRKMLINKYVPSSNNESKHNIHDDFEIMTVQEELEEYKTEYQIGNEENKYEKFDGSSSGTRRKLNRGHSKYLSNNVSPKNSGKALSKFFKKTKINSKGDEEYEIMEASNIDSNSNNQKDGPKFKFSNNQLSNLNSTQGFNMFNKSQLGQGEQSDFDNMRLSMIDQYSPQQRKQNIKTPQLSNQLSKNMIREIESQKEKDRKFAMSPQIRSNNIRNSIIKVGQQESNDKVFKFQQQLDSQLIDQDLDFNSRVKKQMMNSTAAFDKSQNQKDLLKNMIIQQQRVEDQIISSFKLNEKKFNQGSSKQLRDMSKSQVRLPKVARSQNISPENLINRSGMQNTRANKEKHRLKALQVSFEMINGLKN
eukprot:403345897